MAEASKNVQKFLKEGEQVVSVLTGNSYTTSSNPVTRMLSGIIRIFQVIGGSPTRQSVVCTNTRLIIENNQKILYFFDYSFSITAVAPRGVVSVGYNFQRSWFIFRNHYLTLGVSSSEPQFILSKDGYDGVMKMINATESLREKVS